MQTKSHPIKAICNPYVFVLKEGRTIKSNYLDYSLMMLFTYSNEQINSPEDHEFKGIESVIEPFFNIPF